MERTGQSTVIVARGGAIRASDVAYDRLSTRILNLELEPGQVVDEQSLASAVGLGRMPVREALARLAGERLVTVMPRRGMMIAPIGLHTVLEIFHAREAIECGNAYLAAQIMTPEDLIAFREFVMRTETHREPSQSGHFLDADHDVHSFFGDMVHNPFLHDATEWILKHNRRLWNFYFSMRSPQPESLISHVPVLRALEIGDPPAAQRAMREHILTSRALLQSLF